MDAKERLRRNASFIASATRMIRDESLASLLLLAVLDMLNGDARDVLLEEIEKTEPSMMTDVNIDDENILWIEEHLEENIDPDM